MYSAFAPLHVPGTFSPGKARGRGLACAEGRLAHHHSWCALFSVSLCSWSSSTVVKFITGRLGGLETWNFLLLISVCFQKNGRQEKWRFWEKGGKLIFQGAFICRLIFLEEVEGRGGGGSDRCLGSPPIGGPQVNQRWAPQKGRGRQTLLLGSQPASQGNTSWGFQAELGAINLYDHSRISFSSKSVVIRKRYWRRAGG